jgi:hypothetical protein
MDTPATPSFLFDIAAYALYCFFACFAFMTWYLRKNETPEEETNKKYRFWAAILFRYRDFTRKRFGKVHFIYYLALLCLMIVTAVFAIGFYLQVQTLESPLKHIVSIFGVVILSFVIGMFYHIANRDSSE